MEVKKTQNKKGWSKLENSIATSLHVGVKSQSNPVFPAEKNERGKEREKDLSLPHYMYVAYDMMVCKHCALLGTS